MPHDHIATDDPRRLLNRRNLIRQSAAALALPALMKATPTRQGDDMPESPRQSGYAPVNGLQMYYEIHGQGEPLLLLHGAFGTVELWGPILETLAGNRQVIAVELQGHGRTADIDRPMSYEQLADDTAAFMRHLGLASADVFGYSLGGIIALGLAIENPDLVRKLVVVGANYNNEGYYPESLAAIASLTPEMFAGTPLEEAYQEVAPDPTAFPSLVTRILELDQRLRRLARRGPAGDRGSRVDRQRRRRYPPRARRAALPPPRRRSSRGPRRAAPLPAGHPAGHDPRRARGRAR